MTPTRNEEGNENGRRFENRRNDVGSKITWSVLLAAVLGFAGIAWATAVSGGNKADVAVTMLNGDRAMNAEKITRLETQFQAVMFRLETIERNTYDIKKALSNSDRSRTNGNVEGY